MKLVANWLLILLVLGRATDAYSCSPGVLRETSVAPDGTEIPLYSTTDYAFIAKVVGNRKEPKSAPSVEVRVIESWTDRAKTGQTLRIVFTEFICWDDVAPDVSIDVGAYAPGMRVRIVSESLHIPTDTIGVDFAVIAFGP